MRFTQPLDEAKDAMQGCKAVISARPGWRNTTIAAHREYFVRTLYTQRLMGDPGFGPQDIIALTFERWLLGKGI